ncbi:hypothetical protein CSUB01_00038 [Colletotrichum sublineola]|uniref:DUF7580 domain-containing protein n=1 Tax=Colletotrichum sublineola TaxID=1173701 RepID=A0A066Y2A7_COLSU|nr:hypothetical protein CSUB01_00038 [Colletotrichum sublineola]
MSGFEIAGVVLGAFPILCDTAKDLATVFKKTKSWWQFETSFENFVSAIATQEIAYIQVLERLLDPLGITNGEYDGLLKDPRSTLWQEPHIQEELRHCLPQNKFPWFMWNLSELNSAIEGLQSLLPIDKARQCCIAVYYLDSTNIESELYRLQTSFSSEKDRLLKRITDINDDLHQFFDRGSTVTRPTTTKSTIPFRDLHHQAVTFYECLARCWKCCCSVAHTVGITTHPAIKKPSRAAEHGYYNVLFEAEANPWQLRLQVETFKTVECIAALDPAPAAPIIKVDAAIELKSQMLVRNQLKSASSAASENSTQDATEVHTQELGEQVEKASTSEKRGQYSGTQELDRLSVALQSQNGLSRSPSSVSSTTVRFVEAETQPSSAQADEGRNREVKSLCEFVTGADTPHDDKGSMLPLDEGRRVILKPEPSDQSTIKAATTQSIDRFLQTTKVRHIRLSVGLSFDLTLLSLATSSWIPTQPSKDDVFLVCCEPGGKMPKRLGPYFLRTSRDICSSPAPGSPDSNRTWDAKASLLLLGVVLLELFHGQTLEQQASWAESLDDDGQPNENTRFCGAFLWVCRAEESLKEHFGRELGGALSEAIRKCICFDFGRDDDRGDLRLAEMVYKEVVVPLEKCCPQM